MPFFSYRDIAITAMTTAVPKQRITAESYKPLYGEEAVDRFVEMTGIREFHRCAERQTASDLGYVAAERLIREKNLDRNRINALAFVSHTADYRRPATACVLHRRLGLTKECAALDIGLGCSGGIYGIQAVSSMMLNSDIDCALLIVAETPSKVICDKDQSISMMVGDAGSALLFERKEGAEINALLRTDGNGYRSIIVPAGGFRNMNAPREVALWSDGNERTLHNIFMNGTDVFSFSISDVPKAIKDFMSKTETGVEDYDCFALHQANGFIHKQLSKKLKIPMNKIPVSLDRYGNTSAPAVPLTLCDAYGDVKGQRIKTLMCGFGVGLSWGVASTELSTDDIYGIEETDDWFEEGYITAPL